MKITKEILKRIINEELGRVLEGENETLTVRAFTRTNPDDPGDVHYIIRFRSDMSEKPVAYLVDESTYKKIKTHPSFPRFHPQIMKDVLEPFEIATPLPWYRKVGR
jgi:hypothetical protein|tara:strand:- start:1097 stop:1414 length:318 start_codon:yes stop_codon:yes gene_type:complete